MNTYRIFTTNEPSMWICEASSEDDAWESLRSVKKLPIKELKKLFKIEEYVNRTNNND